MSGDIYIPNIQRISHFWKGTEYAFERLYNQYISFECKARAKLESQEPGTILDIGANIGEFSLFCANRFVKSKIFAFEPDPIVHKCLQLNIQSFGMESRVTVLNMALSNRNELGSFYIATSSADSSLIKPETYSEIIDIETSRLDKFLNEADISEVGLLKMDAEGFEPEVIQGLGKFTSCCKILTIDVSPERNGASTLEDSQVLFNSEKFDQEIIRGQGNRIFLVVSLV